MNHGYQFLLAATALAISTALANQAKRWWGLICTSGTRCFSTYQLHGCLILIPEATDGSVGQPQLVILRPAGQTCPTRQPTVAVPHFPGLGQILLIPFAFVFAWHAEERIAIQHGQRFCYGTQQRLLFCSEISARIIWQIDLVDYVHAWIPVDERTQSNLESALAAIRAA